MTRAPIATAKRPAAAPLRAAAGRSVSHAQLLELAGALSREAAVVRELGEALAWQRQAVAGSRPDDLNAAVDAIGRILLTLDEARRGRAAALAALCGETPEPVARLEDAIAGPLPEELTRARADLEAAARAVAHEVAINRSVLRRAVETGEAFLQALFSSAGLPPAAYAPGERAEEPPAGLLLDRRA
jgi:hypothetical protein